MNKNLQTFIGFLLFLYGFIALILSIIGARLTFLAWIDDLGRMPAFLIKISMIVLGVVLVALAQTDWEKERKEIEAAE